MKNKFCDPASLKNEADVETFFVLPLLKALGFTSTNIKLKNSLEELSVKKLNSRRATKYRPDFAIKLGKKYASLLKPNHLQKILKTSYFKLATMQ